MTSYGKQKSVNLEAPSQCCRKQVQQQSEVFSAAPKLSQDQQLQIFFVLKGSKLNLAQEGEEDSVVLRQMSG